MISKRWHERIPSLALVALSTSFRTQLREHNLHHTPQLPHKDKRVQASPRQDDRHLEARTDDGSYNDLRDPQMGMAGTRFGRNVTLKEAVPDRARVRTPDPRMISRRLMTREESKPAEILKVMAAAWIQFQNHDWFSHGNPENRKDVAFQRGEQKWKDEKINIPLRKDDPWPDDRRPMEIDATLDDPSRPEGDFQRPATHINHCTHGWGGSQLYGSSAEKVDELRSRRDGKLKIGEDGRLLEDPGNPETDLTCLNFNHTRLNITAIMARIHTVEWTPGLLPYPALILGTNANWWGLMGQTFKRTFGRINDSEALSGIVGSRQDHDVAPYALKEEFVSVHRLQLLIPDDWKFYASWDGRFLAEKDFQDVSGNRSRG